MLQDTILEIFQLEMKIWFWNLHLGKAICNRFTGQDLPTPLLN